MDTLTQSPRPAESTKTAPEAAMAAPTRPGLVPVRRAPSMTTVNSIGTRLYGKTDLNSSDGSFVATLYFVFLFIPILPLARYLVASTDGRAFAFFGKLPLTGGQKLWRRVALALIAATALAIGANVYLASRRSDVHLVNGLDVPVTVALDEESFELAPGAHKVASAVPMGEHVFAVKGSNGRVLEQQRVGVPGACDVVAYNVLGAAPLYAEGVRYVSELSVRKAGAPQAENPWELHGGTSFVTRDDVEFVFSTPPSTLRLPDHTSATTRWTFQLAEGGWRTTVAMLESRQQPKQAVALAKAVWFADPENEDALEAVLNAEGRTSGESGVLRLCEQLQRELPESTACHRALQGLLMRAGRVEECRARYRTMAAEKPQSVQAAYLRARVEPHETAMKLLGELAAKYPNEAYVHRSYAYALLQSRRFAESAAEMEKLEKLSPGLHVPVIVEHAAALVGDGRVKDALAVFAKRAARSRSPIPFEMAVSYARVALVASSGASMQPAESYVRAQLGADPGEGLAWFHVLAMAGAADDSDFAAFKQPAVREAADLMHAATTDLESASARAAKADPGTLAILDEATLLLLACENARRGDAAAAGRLASVVRRSILNSKDLADVVVSGEDSPSIAELDLEMQAVLRLARARRARDAGRAEEADALERQALRDDVLQGVVTRVLKRAPR